MSSNLAHFDTPLSGQNSKAVHAGSISNEGLLKKVLRILGESYDRYDRNLNSLDPKLWSFMQ